MVNMAILMEFVEVLMGLVLGVGKRFRLELMKSVIGIRTVTIAGWKTVSLYQRGIRTQIGMIAIIFRRRISMLQMRWQRGSRNTKDTWEHLVVNLKAMTQKLVSNTN